jgi:REP element-mobilizing transposase RayT
MPSAHQVSAVFFTATILEWKHLLSHDKYKDIIIESLRYLVADGRVYVYGFVIMNNHIHIVWHIREGNRQEKVQQSFLKYTAQQIKFDLEKHHPEQLQDFYVGACDRHYQFWERNPLSIELWTEAVLLQKLNYVHQNPVRAGLCGEGADYHYSSAAFYEKGINSFGMLRRYERAVMS